VGDGRYDALEAMIDAAKDYNCQTYLKKSSLMAGDVSGAFISMSSLISSSKSRATDILTNRQRTFRDLIREPQSSVDQYLPNEREWIHYKNYPNQRPSVKKTLFNRYSQDWVAQRDVFFDRRAVGIAVRDHIFGEGRERAVRRVREVDTNGDFVGMKLVGKESLFVEDNHDSYSFHKTFCKVQQLAQKMARYFNEKMSELPTVDRRATPTIKFLDCFVMILQDQKNYSSAKFLLVEKMLDHTKYKKWNNNDGYVDGMAFDEYQSMKNEETRTLKQRRKCENLYDDCTFSIEDIPQAYSHFTYLASKRKFLVCDLQGVLNTDVTPPVFELTDPAIHYSEMTSRKDYGRTDRGEHGIQDFFKTHVCSNLCRILLKRWIDDPFGDIIQYEDIMNKEEPLQASQENTKGILMKPKDNKVESVGPKKSVRFG